MTKAFTLDQYEKWVGEYLDFLRGQAEEGEEFVIIAGSMTGNLNLYSPSDNNPHLRFGSLGFHEDAFEEEPGAELLMPLMGNEAHRRRLIGSVPFRRSVLSDAMEENIEEQQEQLEENYPEVATDGGEAIRDRDVSLGEPGEVTVEYSDADGDGFSEEFPLEPGSAMVIEGPDGFMQTYRVPEEVGDER